MKTIIWTFDKMYWCLPIFCFLHNIYFSELQQVIIVGYEPLPFALPDNFTFVSLAPKSYPAKEWSTGIIQFLEQFPDDYFVWSFEDYFLVRGVNHPAISSLESYMACHPDVLRVDLTGDRLYSGRATDRGTWGHLDMIETLADVEYCLSTQMAVVNRKNLLRILRPHLTPWQYELQDQKQALGSLHVMGTRQMPVRYTIGWGNATKDDKGRQYANTAGIPKPQLDFIISQGWLKGHERIVD